MNNLTPNTGEVIKRQCNHLNSSIGSDSVIPPQEQKEIAGVILKCSRESEKS